MFIYGGLNINPISYQQGPPTSTNQNEVSATKNGYSDNKIARLLGVSENREGNAYAAREMEVEITENVFFEDSLVKDLRNMKFAPEGATTVFTSLDRGISILSL